MPWIQHQKATMKIKRKKIKVTRSKQAETKQTHSMAAHAGADELVSVGGCAY